MSKDWMLIRDLSTGVTRVVNRAEGMPLVESSRCSLAGRGWYESAQTAQIDKINDDSRKRTNAAVKSREEHFRGR